MRRAHRVQLNPSQLHPRQHNNPDRGLGMKGMQPADCLSTRAGHKAQPPQQASLTCHLLKAAQLQEAAAVLSGIRAGHARSAAVSTGAQSQAPVLQGSAVPALELAMRGQLRPGTGVHQLQGRCHP